MTRLRGMVAWVVDWRNGATFIGSVLVLLLGFVVVRNAEMGRRSQRNARDAIAAAKQASAASQTIADNAKRRVDLLTGQITDLEDQAHDNGSRIGELLAEVAALSAQVRQLGGRPVVSEPSPSAGTTTTTTRRPSSSPPPPSSPPSTTSTTRPSPPSTTTTTACAVQLLGRCVP